MSSVWQRQNLPAPLISGISNVPAAWVPVMGLVLASELGSGGRLGMLHVHRYPQALEEAPRFSSPPTIPRDVFSFQAGQGWADFFFLLFFSLLIFFKSSGGQCLAPEQGGGSWLVLLGSAHL